MTQFHKHTCRIRPVASWLCCNIGMVIPSQLVISNLTPLESCDWHNAAHGMKIYNIYLPQAQTEYKIINRNPNRQCRHIWRQIKWNTLQSYWTHTKLYIKMIFEMLTLRLKSRDRTFIVPFIIVLPCYSIIWRLWWKTIWYSESTEAIVGKSNMALFFGYNRFVLRSEYQNINIL